RGVKLLIGISRLMQIARESVNELTALGEDVLLVFFRAGALLQADDLLEDDPHDDCQDHQHDHQFNQRKAFLFAHHGSYCVTTVRSVTGLAKFLKLLAPPKAAAAGRAETTITFVIAP